MPYKKGSIHYKKKSVHLENQIHEKLRKKAFDEGTAIEKVVNEILKKKLKEEE